MTTVAVSIALPRGYSLHTAGDGEQERTTRSGDHCHGCTGAHAQDRRPRAMVTAYQLHLPTDLRTFRYSGAPTYSGADALVFDGLVGDEAPVACRSYLYF